MRHRGRGVAWIVAACIAISVPLAAVRTAGAGTGTGLAPMLEITSPHDGFHTNRGFVEVAGTAVDPAGGPVTVTVDDEPVAVGADGSFATRVLLLEADGTQTVTVVARNGSDMVTVQELDIVVDRTAPVLVSVEPDTDVALTWGETVAFRFQSEPGLRARYDIVAAPAVMRLFSFEPPGAAMAETEPGVYEAIYRANNNESFTNATVQFNVSDLAGNFTIVEAPGRLTVGPPSVTAPVITAPVNGAFVRGTDLVVTGTAAPGAEVRVTWTGAAAAVSALTDEDGQWGLVVSLGDGPYTIRAYVVDQHNNEHGDAVDIVADSTPPDVTVTAPADGAEVHSRRFNVSGTVLDANLAALTVTVNGATASVAVQDDQFTVAVDGRPGLNTIEVVAEDKAGNRTAVPLSVTVRERDEPGDTPTIVPPPPPQAGAAAELGEEGGTVTFGQAGVHVPPQTFICPVSGSLTPRSWDSAPPVIGFARIGQFLYEVLFQRADGNAYTAFGQRLAIAIAVGTGDLPADMALRDVVVIQYEPSLGRWVAVPTRHDEETSHVTGLFSYGMLFALADGRGLPRFTDMVDHWAEADLALLVSIGVIDGSAGEEAFRPDDYMTRAEFAELLATALALPLTEDPAARFADAADIPAWAREYVGAVVAAGLMVGDDSSRFRPNALITREQMIVAAARALGITGGGGARFADDEEISPWARSAVHAASAHGLVQGRTDGRLAPAAPATRAEAVRLLAQLMRLHAGYAPAGASPGACE